VPVDLGPHVIDVLQPGLAVDPQVFLILPEESGALAEEKDGDQGEDDDGDGGVAPEKDPDQILGRQPQETETAAGGEDTLREGAGSFGGGGLHPD
jgi:hypothetical protein